MDVFEAIENRRSIRRYDNRDVDDDLVQRVVWAGHMAPSAGNLQARDFIVVKDQRKKKGLAEAALNQMFIANAPVVIAVCGNLKRIRPYGLRGENMYIYHDTAAAIQNMLLAAHALGLGACWVGAFNDEMVSEVLALPAHAVPMALIPIGYPAPGTQTKGTSRLPIKEVLHLEGW